MAFFLQSIYVGEFSQPHPACHEASFREMIFHLFHCGKLLVKHGNEQILVSASSPLLFLSCVSSLCIL